MRLSPNRILLLSRTLAVAVLLEVMLFRIFARGGVYFIREDTPWVLRASYTSLVFMGNVMFNFAALVVLLSLAIVVIQLWRSPDRSLSKALVVPVSLLVLFGGVMIAGASNASLSQLYFATSFLVLVGITALVWRTRLSLSIKAFVSLTAVSYAFVYAFKETAGLSGTGVTSGSNLISLFGSSEWLAVLAFLALIPALRKVIDRQAVIVATVTAFLALGMVAGRADSVPLIATWAFGLSLNLPYITYVIALWIVVAYAVGAYRSGQPLPAVGVLLVFLGHRTLPLTYFNDLAVLGLLLVLLSAWPVADSWPVKSRSLHRRPSIQTGTAS